MGFFDEVVTPQGSAVPSTTVALAGNATLSLDSAGVEIKNDSGNPVPFTDKGSTGVTTVTSFTNTTADTLKAANANRKLLTIYNEGAGILYVLYGSGTASATNYSVKLVSGDYFELEKYTGQVNAVFATTGTARVTEIT